MNTILELCFLLARNLPASRINAIADGLIQNKSNNNLLQSVSSPLAKETIKNLLIAIEDSEMNKEIVASILKSSSYTLAKISETQKVELVLTGPETAIINTRKTEQVLLDLISRAEDELFLVSFVAKGWNALKDAIDTAVARGVTISILMETSKEHGGTLDEDPLAIFENDKKQTVNLYRWMNKDISFNGGKIHAKIAVADKKCAFVTSANFTGHAMEKNFEAGVLITGGSIPKDLHEHLSALVGEGILTKVNRAL